MVARRYVRWPVALRALALLMLVCPGVGAFQYEVKPGESLWVLAKRYGVSIDTLRTKNGIGPSGVIHPGQKLSIPGGKEPSEKEPSAKEKADAAPARKTESAPVKTPESTQDSAPKASAPEASVTKSSVTKPGVTKLQALTRGDRLAAEELYSRGAPTSPESTLTERAPAWVLERPGVGTQVEKSNAARGGVFPCAMPDPGFGEYAKWQQVAPMAHVLIPKQPALGEAGEFDVLFHFHGREPIRKEWVQVMDQTVLVAVDVGIDSASYSTTFQDPRTLGQVLRAVEKAVTEQANKTETTKTEATVRHVGVSAWSAGYGAVERILGQPYGREVIDAVVLLDGLHSGYTEHSLDGVRLGPFVEFAERAVRQETFMYVSHSSILTRGYASTTETAQYLVWRVGGRVQPNTSRANDPLGLERIASYSSGNFHVRGFRGIGAADHCAHIGLMRDVLRVHLQPRWATQQRKPPPKDAPVAMN